MDFNSQETQPSSGGEPPGYSFLFGLPNDQNTLYQGFHDNNFGHQQNLGPGSHMPTYDGGQVVGAPHSQWRRPSHHSWHHPNINASDTYDLGAVSYCLLLTTNYI